LEQSNSKLEELLEEIKTENIENVKSILNDSNNNNVILNINEQNKNGD